MIGYHWVSFDLSDTEESVKAKMDLSKRVFISVSDDIEAWRPKINSSFGIISICFMVQYENKNNNTDIDISEENTKPMMSKNVNGDYIPTNTTNYNTETVTMTEEDRNRVTVFLMNPKKTIQSYSVVGLIRRADSGARIERYVDDGYMFEYDKIFNKIIELINPVIGID